MSSSTLQFKIPSVDKEVKSDMPPTFIFHTADDKTVPVANSVLMAYALTKNRIPYELHIFASGSHGLSLGKKLVDNGTGSSINPSAAQWLPLSVAWLEKTLKPFS
jgi:dipeptidyl aminopeptidase/acylaminoacyl peptidase